MKLIITFFSLIIVLVWLTQLPYPGRTESTLHPVLKDSGTSQSEREKQIQQCGSCHPQIYDNWKKGPHAQAYAKLQEHRDYVHRTPNFPIEYAQLVRDNFTICAGCHVTEDIYENSLAGLGEELDLSRFKIEDHPELLALPKARPVSIDWNTGVDCLTCHIKDGKVVTNAQFKKDPNLPPATGQCEPIASNVFSSDLNCITCHSFSVTSKMKLHPLGEVGEGTCVSCHQEYDASGKGTHYFYWRHDPEEKKRPESLYVFENIRTEVRWEGENPILSFIWKNEHTPHAFSECGEAIAYVEVLDADGQTIYTAEHRLNRKQFHDHNLEHYFKDNPIPGIVGDPFDPEGEGIVEETPLNMKTKRGIVRITGKQKAQYWSNDREAIELYRKETPFSAPQTMLE